MELAKRDLIKTVELNGRHVMARELLAEFYLKQRDEALASEQIKTLLSIAPKEPRVWMLKAGLQLLYKDVKGAQEVFEKSYRACAAFCSTLR